MEQGEGWVRLTSRHNRGSRALVFAAAGAFAFGGIVCDVARAEDTPTTIIIVDGSASMWGRLPPDNRAKIEVVREKLSASLRAAPQTRVGLVSFGQRRADCTDAEVINAPDTAHDAALNTLAMLNPRGRGPLANALRAAAGAISASRPAQILIVSDGADNCAQDACKAADDFAKASPDVPVNVIGVAIAPNEKPLVACVANSTGGKYFEAATSTDFAAALDEGAKLALLAPGTTSQPAAPKAAPTAPGATPTAPSAPALPPPPPAGAALRIAASLSKNGPTLSVPVKWRIFKSGETSPAAESQGQAIAVKIPPGDYEIEARLGGLSSRENVTVAAGSAQSIVVPLNGAHIVARAGATKGGSPSPTAVVSLSSGEKTVALVRGSVIDLFVPPAKYTLLAVDGTSRQSQELALAAGDDKTADIVLRTGTIDLSAATGSGAVKDVLFTISEDDPESQSGRREVARSRAPQAAFTLPAGTYYVSARAGKAEANDRIALNIGDQAKRTLNLAVSTLKVTATVGGTAPPSGRTVVFRIDKIDGDKTEVDRAMGSAAEFDMPPGRYRVTATLPNYHLSASKEVALEPGKVNEQQIDIASGEIKFAPPAGNAAGPLDIYWEVRDLRGIAVWRATGGAVTAVLAPGTYVVHLDSRGKRKTATFDVRAGESRTIEIGPG